MKYNTNLLPIVPYIIAERAAWNVIEKEDKYNDWTGEQISALVSELEPQLTAKFERIYNVNPSFRKQINDKRKDMRYTTEMFMEHWVKSILKTKN